MVSTNMRVIPEFRQLEIGMSTKRYLPAIGTAGLDLVAVKGNNRVILCTDGDFNVGVSNTNELENLIVGKRKTSPG